MENSSYLEVKEILYRLKENDRKKIPDNIIELINNKVKQPMYKINIDNTIGLEKQISREALGLLTFLTLTYMATPKQKQDMKNKLIKNQKEINNTYKNINEIFSNSNNNNLKKDTNIEIIETKDTILKRIISFFKSLFK